MLIFLDPNPWLDGNSSLYGECTASDEAYEHTALVQIISTSTGVTLSVKMAKSGLQQPWLTPPRLIVNHSDVRVVPPAALRNFVKAEARLTTRILTRIGGAPYISRSISSTASKSTLYIGVPAVLVLNGALASFCSWVYS